MPAKWLRFFTDWQVSRAKLEACGSKEVDQEMLDAVTWFVDDEDGASAIEYGLIGALVSVAGLAALGMAGGALDQMLTQVANVMLPPSP